MTTPVLPIALSEETVQRLAFLRYVFGLGERQSSAPEPLASAALLMFQDSVELFLVLVAERLNVFKKGMQFLEYFAAINNAIQPDALAERGSMVRLNDARVSLKHYSNPPSRSSVESFRDSTRAFFELNTSKLFALPFDGISLAYLVTDRATRDALEAANRDRAAGNLDKSAEGLAAALAYLFKAFGIQAHAAHSSP